MSTNVHELIMRALNAPTADNRETANRILREFLSARLVVAELDWLDELRAGAVALDGPDSLGADQLAAIRAARAVVRAWAVDGPEPALTERERGRLGAHWPVMARAITSLRVAVDYMDARHSRRSSTSTVHAPPAWRLDRPDQEGTIT